MKSALFVDFDNVYTQLRQVQPAAAERFARQPIEWIRWLTESLEIPVGHDPAARRRLLVRRCYLNPNWYQTYRHAFLRAGQRPDPGSPGLLLVWRLEGFRVRRPQPAWHGWRAFLHAGEDGDHALALRRRCRVVHHAGLALTTPVPPP